VLETDALVYQRDGRKESYVARHSEFRGSRVLRSNAHLLAQQEAIRNSTIASPLALSVRLAAACMNPGEGLRGHSL
jgi:hypothetical protein